jgi:hypothetical protein
MRYLATFGSVSFLVVGLTVIAAASKTKADNEETVRRRLASMFLYDDAEHAFPVIEYKAGHDVAKSDPKHPDFVLIEHKGPHVVEFYSPMYVHH